MSQTPVVTVGYFLRLKKSLTGGLDEVQLCLRIFDLEQELDHMFFHEPTSRREVKNWLFGAIPVNHQILVVDKLVDELKLLGVREL